MFLYSSWKKVPVLCLNGVITFSPIIFLLSSLIFNLYNWIYQIAQMKSYLSKKYYTKTINSTLIVLQTIFGLLLILLGILSCEIIDNLNGVFRVYSGISALWYYIITIAYPVTAYVYFKTLQAFFEAKANNMKKRLFISVALISIPIFIRATFNLIIFAGVSITFQNKAIEN